MWTTRLLGMAALLILLPPPPTARAETAVAPMPRESSAFNQTRRLLPEDFVVQETTRYVVLSDADAAWTREQAQILEHAYHQFHRYCRRIGLQPQPLRHKLVAVVFQNREEYRQFARQHDDVADPSLSGYYSPRHDRIVFYDIESSPSVAEARQQLALMESEIQEITTRLSHAVAPDETESLAALRRIRSQYRRHWSQQRQRVDDYAAETSIATTVHEAVHQLMFHTSVQSPRVHYPLWISEGLATAFETDEPDSAFGPGYRYDARHRDFRDLIEQDRLMPLRDLVTVCSLSGEHADHSSVLYHQSHGLVDWLSRRRPDELRRYLQSMRRREGERLAVADHLDVFEEAFGDIAELEREWLREEKGRLLTQTP